MKILVLDHPRVRSKIHFNDIANTPLWSCLMAGYVSAFLMKKGLDVTYIDAVEERLTFEDTKDKIFSIAPDILSVNAVYLWENTKMLFEFLHDVKIGLKNLHINRFGFFPSLGFYGILQNCDFIDSIAVGECEQTIFELIHSIKEGADIKMLPGIVTTKYKRLTVFRKPQKDPDIFPFPHRVQKNFTTISILGSRGCYNQCSFCPIPVFYNQGPLWRGRSIQNILEEMTELVTMGYRDFYFVDPNFIGPGARGKERAKNLLSEIKRLGVTLGLETRANDIDDEIAACFPEAGVKSLLIGLESACANVLTKIGKKTNPNVSRKAIEYLRKYKLEPEIGFIMFEPDMTREEIIENFNFLMENNLLDRLDRTTNLLSHKLIVFANTPGFFYYSSQGRVKRLDSYGFEAEISYVDDKVLAISNIVINLCLYILSEMSKQGSPIYWQGSMYDQGPIEINKLLIELFAWIISLDIDKVDIEGITKEGITQIEMTLNSLRKNRNFTMPDP